MSAWTVSTLVPARRSRNPSASAVPSGSATPSPSRARRRSGRTGRVDPDPSVQARRCWEIALAALEELGGRVEDVVRTRQYVVTPDVADAVGAVHGEIFGDVRPASTMVVVAGLLDPRWLVEVEIDAVVD